MRDTLRVAVVSQLQINHSSIFTNSRYQSCRICDSGIAGVRDFAVRILQPAVRACLFSVKLIYDS